MTTTLPCVELEPRDGAVEAAVIWLHGLGASGHDFEPIVPLLNVARTRFVFPHAPSRPVTINGGVSMPAWYDILSLEPTSTRESDADVEESAALIRALLERERERGVPAERTVLAGFSQGGALALHVGIQEPDALAGIMVLSAYALQDRKVSKRWVDAQRRTPFLFAHGRRDEIVPSKRGRRAYELIHTLHAAPDEVRWHDYPMGHEVCIEELQTVGGWLRRVLRVETP